jgi:RHS repeat-associated protein
MEPQHQFTNGEPVNVATGEYVLPAVDIDIPGTLPLQLTRRHRSQFRHGLWFGPRWIGTFDSRAVVTDSEVTTIDSDGTMLVFDHPSPGEPSSPHHSQGWLLYADSSGGYRLTENRSTRSVHFTPLAQLAGTDVEVGVIAASSITDRNGNRIDLIYNESGVPLRIEHNGGYTVDVACSSGRIRGYTVAGQEIRRFDYTNGDLTSVSNGVGAVTRFAYDDWHRVISWTDSVGARYDNTYDSDGRVISQTGTNGIWAATFDYRSDENGRCTVFADALGRKTTYYFDDELRPNVVTDSTGRTTHTTFAQALDPLTLTNAAGGTTSYRYGDDDRLVEVTDPLGHVMAFDYADSMLSQTTGPDGALTRYEYDERGNLITCDCAGARHRWERDESGSVSAYIDPAGRRTEITCSPAGLPVRIADPRGNETRLRYDDLGRPITVVHADGTSTSTKYDAEGRPTSRQTADGSEESWTYDGEGNCLTFTNAAGAVTRWEYGYYDLVTARIDADGARTEYGYNSARQLISVTNPAGLVWSFAYRSDGLLISEADFNGATITYAYDSAGRLTSRTNGAGQTVSYTYDVLGNVATETSSAAAEVDFDLFEERISYGYDAMGRRISATNAAGQLDLVRDPIGRVVAESWNGREVMSTFNAAGDLLDIRTPSGLLTRLSYDGRGVAEVLTVDGRPCEVTTDALGRPTRYRYGTVDVDSTWDQVGRLTARSVGVSKLAQLASAKYDYRADGALMEVNSSEGSAALCTVARYDSDITGRLTARTLPNGSRQTFHFDSSQNLATRGDKRWQYRGVLLVDDGRSRYSYDRAGRLTTVSTRRLSRKPDVWQYKWDAWDRLRELITPNGMTFRYTYDPLGRRVTKEGSDGTRTDFCWSQTRMIEQVATVSGANRSVTSWAYLPGELSPQIQVSQDAVDREFFALVTDQIGSPVALVDPAAENLAGQSETTAWGLARWTGVSTPWRFPGQYHDEESGLHYNFHRYYDPDAGRYISPDPLGLAPAPNPYGYPANPTGWVDPFGLNPCQGGPPGSEVLHHYGPHEKGPLPSNLADTFRSGTYTEMVTTEPITLYRAYTEGAHPLGNFWSRDVSMGPMQTQMDSALNPAWGNQATAVSSIQVPAGTTFYEGIVGPQPIAGGGILLGGGDQIVFTPGFRVPMDWLR